jgi:hypothetical protein
MRPVFAAILTIIVVISACRKTASRTDSTTMVPEPVIIVKVDKEYAERLTVQTSDNGREITAFPAQSEASGQKPLNLSGGYYLRRMTGDTYLSISIDDYAEAKRTFSPGDLERLILDEDPVIELYDCSACVSTDTVALNRFIKEGGLSTCIRLK